MSFSELKVIDIAILKALLKPEGDYAYNLAKNLSNFCRATLYKRLQYLEKHKLLVSKILATVKNPSRRYYYLTSAGKRRLSQSLSLLLDTETADLLLQRQKYVINLAFVHRLRTLWLLLQSSKIR